MFGPKTLCEADSGGELTGITTQQYFRHIVDFGDFLRNFAPGRVRGTNG